MKLYRIILVVFVFLFLAGWLSPVVSQNHFKVVGGIPHFPVMEPGSISSPEHGMIIFSDVEQKPLIYTNNGWETLCTLNLTDASLDEFFTVKNGIPFLPSLSLIPASPKAGSVYYSVVNKAMMIYNGTAWFKMPQMKSGAFTSDGGFASGPDISTYKLPIANTPPNILSISKGAFYINALSRSIKYFDGTLWKDISCQAIVTTAPVTSQTGYEATSGGEVLTNGSSDVSQVGICWSPFPEPDTLLVTKTRLATVGDGIGSFVSQMTDLLPKTKYYVRAYAVNQEGIVYGQDVIFTTPVALPTIITLPTDSLSSTRVISGGNIFADGGSPITHRGIIWSKQGDPLDDQSHNITDDGSGVGKFPSTLMNLLGSTTYYIRAYAVNSAGKAYGNLIVFTTKPPVVPRMSSSILISAITGSSASTSSMIIDNGGDPVIERGVCISTDRLTYQYIPSSTVTPTDIGNFKNDLSGLVSGTVYYVKAYAKNAIGIGYSSETSFSTSSSINMTTVPPSDISNKAATSGGVIIDAGVTNITAKGICWDTIPNPVITLNTKTSVPIVNDGTDNFSSNLTGLKAGIKYYVRAYAVNTNGISYGNLDSLVTLTVPSVSTVNISSIVNNTATSGGIVVADGGTPVTSRGLCWSQNHNPTIYSSNTPCGSGLGLFGGKVTGLTANITYYVRAYATNAIGTAYGEEKSVMIIPGVTGVLVVTTSDISDITYSSAKGGGNVTDDGGAEITKRGVLWSYAEDPLQDVNAGSADSGTGNGEFSSLLKQLLGSKTYYVRAYATNDYGTAYGDIVEFTTQPPVLPKLTKPTFNKADLTNNTAIGSFEITENGGAPITTRGIAYSTDNANFFYANTPNTNLSDIGNFLTSLTGLTKATVYYAKAFAINSVGIAFSDAVTFRTNSIPELTTAAHGNITITSATSGGYVSFNGNDLIKAKGVCWSTFPDPIYNLPTRTSEALDGTDLGSFVSSLSGLTPGTKYYIRAYAVNSYGVGYGNQDSIITMPHAAPLLTTIAPSVITGTSANSGGNISYAGESPVTVCGVCWSTSPNPTIALSTKTSGPASGIGSFTSVLTTLIPNTKYYVRAYARNSLGISYGNSDSLLTATLPSGITTARPSEITKSSAICGGEVTNDGRTPITIRGVCWGTSPNPTVYNNSATGGSGTGIFACNATNLLASTKYYIRAYATNDVGTVYGNLDSLVTGPPSIPIVSTTMVNNIAGVSAMGNGNVLENGGAPVTERGICWNNTGNPSISDNYVQSGSGNGAFSGNITGLTPISTYYVRAYAVNSIGIAYGNEVSFATFTNASVVTSPVTTFTNVSAIGGGQITSDGGTPVTTSGICWNITGNPTISDTHTTGNTGIGDFIHNMEDLKASTKYYVRAYAINNAGITYGNVQTFTTGDPTVPLLVTSTATVNPSGKSALCGGTISSNGGDEIKTVGVVWCTVSGFKPDTVVTNRVTQIGNRSFSVTLPNLALGVTYYVKAFATNKAGTAYALNEVIFTNYNFPEVTTLPVSNIATTTADASGNISSNGGTDVSVSGVCWSTGTNPTTADNKTENNTGIGTFISSVTDLLGSTQYYVRAYATNSVGTAYGAVVSFTTKPPVLPTVVTQAVSVNSATAAVSGGNITNNGGALVTTRGIFWCTQANFNTDTILVNKTAETGYFKGSFTSKMTGLKPNTVYYVKAYAVNSLGMAFGEEVSFKTPYKPSVFTKAGISNGPTKATTGGDITDSGNADISDRGVVYSTMPGFIPDTVLVRITHDGGGDGRFSSKLTGLKGNTTYYVTAFATNIAGTSYGNLISFITDPPTLPTVTTADASDINGTYVTGGGNISEDGGETVTTRGLVWSTVSGFRADTVVVNKTAAVGYGKGSFSASINRLRQGVTYYFRAYAVNSVGTAYGKELSFTTFNLPTLTTMNALPASDAKSASSGGTIIDDGGTPIIDQGVCWSLFSNPTVSLPTKTSGDAGDGKNFYSNIVGLNPITKYYVKAYAVNNQGTAYGNELTFTTPPAKPTITTNIVVPISQSSIVTGGKILTDGGAAVTSRGLVWSTNPNFNPDTVSVNKVVNASNSNNFTSTVIGLKTSIAYYIRAYAVNSAGTGYGNQVTFTLFPTAPLLNTVDVLQVGGASANSGGVITSDGGAEITQKGICWATHTNPTIDDVYTINGSGTDNFSAALTGLKPNTLYYVRAYAINKIGVAYGVEKTILTNALPTLLATVPATNIIATTATSGGEITDDGRSPILAKGICWDTRMNPTIALSTKTVDNSPGIGTFAADMSGLSPETTYYVRAYATNAVGTSYGTQITFRTKAVFLPVLTTIKPFNIDSVKAISGGIITNDGGMPVTERGICWSAFPRPSTSLATRVSDLAGGNGTFSLGFKGLIPGTKYYVRAYAVNSKGIAYGNQDSLITQAVKPAVSNVVVSGLTKTTAVATASVITDGGAYVTVRGFCWTTSGVPSIANDTLHVGAGIGSFATTIKNLIQGTAYNIRAFAINSAGIVYGPVYLFTTLTVPTLTTLDISGLNVTKTASDIIVNVASGGNITSDGGAAVTARGVCWSTSPGATEQATTKTTNGSGTGAFASAVNGLAMETTYYIRAYATNSAGIGYGNEIVYMPPKLPVVTTAPATISSTSASTANGGGEVTSDGGNHVTARGVCWSTAPGSSSVSGLHSTDGADVGVFNSTLIGLASSSTYYVRAYATNAIGTVYGNEVSFNTPSLPTVTTVPMISSVDTAGLATGGGSIINDGGAAVTVRGVCWSASSNPLATGLHTSNSEGIGDFISKITGLNAGTKYYVRAYATNSVGTAYGNEVTVSTPVVPTVTTYPASISYIDPSMATGGGEVTATGGAPVTARGVYWSTSNAVPALNAPHSSDGDGMGTFASSITALVSGTTYYVRAYATNIIGTGFGSPVSITAPTAPIVTTIQPVSSTTNNSQALGGGIITSDGGAPVTSRGVCWSNVTSAPTTANSKSVDGTGAGLFNSTITGLANGTTYYVRAYAINAIGISYGPYASFVTKNIPTVYTVAPVLSSDEPGVASSGGNITDDGGAAITARGVCWSLTNATPTLADGYTVDGAGTGIFSSTLAGLDATKNYYVRAYATNAAGTAYGSVISPTTATVTTSTVTTSTSDNSVAYCGGIVSDEGGASVLTRGVCWWPNNTVPTINNAHTSDGTRTGSFNSTLTGLANGTTYYVRAYATNAKGTVYGAYTYFTTKTIPTVYTTAPTVSSDEPGVAKSGGNVTDDGGSAVIARGVCWSLTNGSPTLADDHTTDNSGTGVFSSTLTGLDATKNYYIRAYATNAAGTAYGSVISPTAATVTTGTVTISTSDNSVAYCGGIVSDEGGASVLTRGVCWWPNNTVPTINNAHTSDGTRTGSFNSTLTGLANGTTYYVRAYATNAKGTVYGAYTYFTTKTIPTVYTTAPTVSSDEPGVAKSGGNVTDDGGSAVIARGVCWSLTNGSPTLADDHTTDNSGTGVFSSTLTGLDATKNYYIRAYATNAAGTAYGSVISPTAATVTTGTVTISTSDNSVAYCGGIVSDEGGASVLTRGVCWWPNNTVPTINNAHTSDGTRTGSFNSTLTGLANGTTYYVRAYATNAKGTVYGAYTYFTTKTIPTVYTTAPTVSSDEPGVAKSGGNVTDDGGSAVIARGVCWSLTNGSPTLADDHTTDNSGTGVFSSTLTGLDATKNYYIRAYATNAAGTAYGSVISPTAATVTTGTVTISTSDNSVAYCGGIVSDEGGASVLTRGVCWWPNNTVPTINNAHTSDGTRTGSFNSTLTGLANGTTYYVRAYATNAKGTVYGAYTYFTTKTIPTVYTTAPTVSSDEPGVAKSGGNVTDDGGSAVIARGVCWSLTNGSPTLADDHTTDNSGTGVFSSTLTGLDATKRYYIRAYATNAAGTAYGSVISPTTPTVVTSGVIVSASGNTTAVSGGRITDEGGAAVLARGVCWWPNNAVPTINNPHTSDGTRSGSFSSTLTGLINGTTYYYRSYATNALGTVYGPYSYFTAGTITSTITTVVPKVTTNIPVISSDRPSVASSGGNVYDDGGAAIIARGVCWSTTNATPTLADAHTSDGTGAGNFNSTLSGLDASKKYYVRAYATNSAGLAYGNVVTPGLPSVITTAVTLSDANNSLASGGGMVTDEGGAEVTARGICWLPNNGAPTIANPKTVDGDRNGSFSSAITGLVNGTTYYIRAYATNAYGTSYGPYVPVTTKVIPTVTTNVPSISTDKPSVASSGGNVTNDGGAAITARGVCWSTTNATPTLADAHTSDGTGAGNFNSTLIGLDASKRYYVRAYATNSAGLAYGNVVTAGLPSVITTAVALSDTNNSLASGGGMVTDEGGAEVTARGICWLPNNGAPTIANPKTVDGDRNGSFSSAITGLVNGTTYYIRAYATNAYGTSYGPYVPVTTKVIPTVTTSVPSISTDKPSVASSGGNVTNDGGASITARGVCWSTTNATPTLADAHTSDGTGAGNFNSTLSGLDASKKYYVRAYATNSAGLAYGNVVTPGLPSVITTAVTLSDTNNSLASGGGMVTDEGGAEVTARGICWLPNNGAPTIANPKTVDGDRSGNFSSAITGLVNGTTYYIRAYATNVYGTSYGPYVPVTTKVIPTVTTNVPSISTDKPSVASSGGNVTNDGGADITARGVCWSTTNATPTLADAHTSDGTGAGNFNSTLSGLDASKKYYVRAYATNSAGLAYGNVVTPGLPSVITTAVTLSDANNSLASGGGLVTDEGGAEVTARGICWLPNNGAPTTANPKTVDGDRSGNFSSAITGLVNGTTYYIRAYATNAYGTSYGPYVPVTTKVIPTVTTNVPSISTDKPSVASSGGNVTNDGGAAIKARGVCWSTTNATPTLADAHTSDGTGAGNFNSTLTGLDASKKYYVRSYATNSAGLAYGNVVTPGLPSVITTAVTLSDTNNSLASGGGVVTDEGGAEVTARGICWLPNNGAPTTANPKTVDGDRSGNFSSAITGLVNGTTYYIRAYATNVYGTSYGPYVPVTTKVIPTVTTNVPSISGDKPGIVFSGGNITNDGGASITEKGVCWSSTNATPTLADTHSSDGAGAGNFSSVLSGLDATKTYYVRAYAKNSAGIAYGNVTTPGLPSVITGKVTLSESDVSLATGGGTVTSEGGIEVYARGICWSSTTGAPTIANSPFTTDYSRSGIFTSSLSGLKKGTTYYVRAYATNALGTVYGSYVMFVVP